MIKHQTGTQEFQKDLKSTVRHVRRRKIAKQKKGEAGFDVSRPWKNEFDPERKKINQMLRQIRRRKRKARIAASKKSAEYCRGLAHHDKVNYNIGAGIFKREKKKGIMDVMKKWLLGSDERKTERDRKHKADLKEKYHKLETKFKEKNNFTDDSEVKYNPVTKKVKIIKGKIKPKAKDVKKQTKKESKKESKK